MDVCSDQEAVDLVRNQQDPQAASKVLVDHALARFSTDNLSCMIVRFDSKAVQEAVQQKTEPIGVEGDPGTKEGGPSEADQLVAESRKKLEDSGVSSDSLVKVPTEIIQAEEEAEPGPELNVEALREEALKVIAKENKEGNKSFPATQ